MSGVYIIAEAGVNHNGSPDMAHRLIDIAADAGADAVKFQTWDRELVTRRDNALVEYQKAGTSGVNDMYELGKTFELEQSVFVDLARHCVARSIEFLSTGFDLPSLKFLVEELNIQRIKIPSGDVDNVPLVRLAGSYGLPIILSTGMCNLSDVNLGIETLRKARAKISDDPLDITLLHCTTAYPTPDRDMNIKAMTTLHEEFSLPIGLSDHSNGTIAAVVAVGLGAKIIEKHYTLDRSLPGPDHMASADPETLFRLVASIRTAETMLGSAEKRLLPIEKDVVKSVRRSLVAARDIALGETIADDDVVALRPNDGIPARDIDRVVGSVAWRHFSAGEKLDLPNPHIDISLKTGGT